MNPRRILVSSLVLFAFALVWNGVLHGVILKDVNALVASLRRENFGDMLVYSILMTYGIALLFSIGYSRIRKSGEWKEGMLYGLAFGLLAGLLVDLNQYILYPIPAHVAFSWFAGGVVEFTIYGVIATRIFISNKP